MITEQLAPVQDGYRNFGGGMDASALSPGDYQPDQVRFHVNNRCDDGRVRPRPGWEHIILRGDDRTFREGLVQGVRDVEGKLLVSVDGNLYLFDPWTETITLANPPEGRALNRYARQVYISPRSGAVVAGDGVNAPVVVEGQVARKAGVERDFISTGTPQELRVGTVMADAGGRLHIASPDRTKFWSSDHEMDPETTPLTFKELEDYYLGARSIIAPSSYGRIVGMAPYFDQEILVVWHEERTRLYAMTTPRDQWVSKDIVVRSIARGLCGPNAWVVLDNLIYWVDQEGRLTSLIEAQEADNRLEVRRIDSEIEPLIRHESGEARQQIWLSDFDGRLLRTAFPEVYTVEPGTPRQRTGIRWRGLLALNYDVKSTMEGPRRPSWDGLWTGPNIVAMSPVLVRGERQFYAISRDDDGLNRIYRLRPDRGFDQVPAGYGTGSVRRRIRRQIHMRSFDGGRRSLLKSTLEASIAIAEIRGKVDIEIRQSVNDRMDSVTWWKHSDAAGDQLRQKDGQWFQPSPQSRVIPLPKSPATPPCDPATGDKLKEFYSVEPVILIEGQCAVCEFDITLKAQPTDTRAKCAAIRETDLVAREDLLDYSFKTAVAEK